MLTKKGDRVRVHPASTNSKLRIEREEWEEGQEPPPQFAALMFFDEITRGDAFLCEYYYYCSGQAHGNTSLMLFSSDSMSVRCPGAAL